MDGVGTQQGDVHRQRQGTGLATVLGGASDIAAKAYISQAEAAAAERRAAKDAAKKAADEAVSKMKDFAPEFWFAHDAEIKGEIDSWHDQGAKLLAGGTNPWTGVDQASVQWRKKASRIKQQAAYSMQLKSYHDATRTKILESPPDKYTDESVAAQEQYWNGRSLGEFVDNPLEPPMLVERKPLINAMTTWNEVMKAEQEKFPGRDMTETEIAQVAERVMRDTTGAELAETYNSQLATMDQAQKTDLQARAVKAQRNIYAQMAFEDAQASIKQKEPIDFRKIVTTATAEVNKNRTDKVWQKGEEQGKSADLKDMKAKSESQARLLMANRYDAARMIAEAEATGVVPRDPKLTDAEYAKEVETWLANEIYLNAEKDSEYRITSAGQGEKELKESEDQWIKDLYSGNPSLAENAASHFQNAEFFDMETKRSYLSTEIRDGQQVPVLFVSLEGTPRTYQEQYGDQAEATFSALSPSQQAEEQGKAIDKAAEEAGIPKDKYRYRQNGTFMELEMVLDRDTEARFRSMFRKHGQVYQTLAKPTTVRENIVPQTPTLQTQGANTPQRPVLKRQ